MGSQITKMVSKMPGLKNIKFMPLGIILMLSIALSGLSNAQSISSIPYKPVLLGILDSSNNFCQIGTSLASAVGLSGPNALQTLGLLVFIAVLGIGFGIAGLRVLFIKIGEGTSAGLGTNANQSPDVSNTLFKFMQDNLAFFLAGFGIALAILIYATVIC
ncbi:MAG: hypothetical protein ACP5IV_07830 [Caldisericia bacterium]